MPSAPPKKGSRTGSKHPQEVLAQDFADVAVRVAAAPQGPDELRLRRRVFHGSGQHADSIEIAPKPDVIDSNQLLVMIYLIQQERDSRDDTVYVCVPHIFD